MNEVPPDPQEADEADERYRRASAQDASRPSELVRRRILNHAAQLAAERAPRSKLAGSGSRRPVIFGTLAAAGLACLLIAPQFISTQFIAPRAPATAPSSTADVADSNSARQYASASREEEPPASSLTEAQRAAKPKVFARTAAPSAGTAVESGAKNMPAREQRMASALSSASSVADVASDSSAVAGAPAAPPQPAASESAGPAAELRRAAQLGDTGALQTILNAVPRLDARDIDARDEGGRTALMLATLAAQRAAVAMLLAHGADPNAADARGITPLQAAIAENQPAIAAALQRGGAR
jgi:hypothetical protein